VTLDDLLVRQLQDDYTQAALEVRDRAMLDYAVLLTKDPLAVSPAEHNKLRAVGFDAPKVRLKRTGCT
jgi:uncharacterized protein YciW